MRRSPFSAVVLLALAACASGQRPSLVDVETANDDVVQSVLDRLAIAESTTFTASYTIIPSLTGVPTNATVIQSGGRRRVTIGAVDFRTDGAASRTCSDGGVNCIDGIDEARVSDLNVTHLFWGSSFAQRLGTDASRNVGGTQGRIESIAGQPASCADITVPSIDGTGVVTYCAIDAGPLARYFGADVTIELTSFAPTADEALLAP